MRAVIQRVLRASVRVNDETISAIERGLCVLIGIAHDDDLTDLEYIAKKLLTIRLWPSDDGSKNWTRAVREIDGALLCVSQFTLHATLKGTKPDFHLAMSADASRNLYEKLLQTLKNQYRTDRIFDGQFGAMMNVQIGKTRRGSRPRSLLFLCFRKRRSGDDYSRQSNEKIFEH